MLRQPPAVYVDAPLPDINRISWQPDYALDKGFRPVERIPEDHDVASPNRLEAINELVDEDALLIGNHRGHAGAFDFYGLVEKDDDDESETERQQEISCPYAQFAMKWRHNRLCFAHFRQLSVRRIHGGA